MTAKSSPDLYFLCPHPEQLSNLMNRLQTRISALSLSARRGKGSTDLPGAPGPLHQENPTDAAHGNAGLWGRHDRAVYQPRKGSYKK